MLKNLAYYQTGGNCDELFEPESERELAAKMQNIAGEAREFFVLGGGTNSLVLDQHYPGIVIHLGKMQQLEMTSQDSIWIGAGVENTAIAQFALQHQLAGAAWMNRLPGKLGGTARMNARCYGGEIGNIISEISSVSHQGKIERFRITGDRSIFRGYKDTLFMENGSIITGVKLQLSRTDDTSEIRKLMKHCEDDRIAKGQFQHPSCGCVFKNDYRVGVPSGMLLDAAGASRLNTKTVQVNPKHANFVFNLGASSQEILDFTLAMREGVFDRFGVWLDYEMELLGKPDPSTAKAIAEKRPSQPNTKLLTELREAFKARQRPV